MSGQTRLIRLRRISQVFFFLLFLLFLVRTTAWTSTQGHGWPHPFLLLDPLPAWIGGLAGRAYSARIFWPLALILPTLLLGRFFCGWICPMGALQQWIAGMRPRSARLKTRDSNRYRLWQRTKYSLLMAGGVASVFGIGILAWIDPLVLLTRAAGIGFLPQAASHKFVAAAQPHYGAGLIVLAGFVLLLAASLLVTRLWCRLLCPLGAMLGVLARWSPLRLHKDESACSHCGRCTASCQGGDDPVPGADWCHEECHLCMSCVASCPHHCLRFSFAPQHSRHEVRLDRAKRASLVAIVSGLAAIPVAHAQSLLGRRARPTVVRPPGAQDEAELLARCVRCAECIRLCPNHALQPAILEAGAMGFWSPMLMPKIGYCDPECVLCSQVCPTGAIAALTVAQKGWTNAPDRAKEPIRLGLARYDRNRCLPWAKEQECSVCMESCPVMPKAICVERATAVSQAIRVARPRIATEICVGCGACVSACPLDSPAVEIYGIESETMHSPIL
jgi:polyferredoxin